MTAISTRQGGAVAVDVRTPQRQENASKPALAASSSRRSQTNASTVTGWAVVAFIGLAVWFLIFGLVLTGLQEHGAQVRLYQQYRLQLANATAPVGGAIKAGSPVALVTAPSGELHSVVVVEGTTSAQLTAGPGHLRDTPLPGQVGDAVGPRAERDLRWAVPAHHEHEGGRPDHRHHWTGSVPVQGPGRSSPRRPAAGRR